MSNCEICGGETILLESYKRGRREWEVNQCTECGIIKRIKGNKVPYNKVGRF